MSLAPANRRYGALVAPLEPLWTLCAAPSQELRSAPEGVLLDG